MATLSRVAKTASNRQGAIMLLALARGELKCLPFDQEMRILCVFSQPARYLGTKAQIDENVRQFKKGSRELVAEPTQAVHFREKARQDDLKLRGIEYEVGENTLPHPIWTPEETGGVQVTHKEPDGLLDQVAKRHIKVLRWCFDFFSGFSFGQRTEKKWLRRVMFLETVAGVPGMVGAMVRHLQSLRKMRRDHGWIHTLIEEAENERMHLMTALQVRKPGILFRAAVIGSQAIWLPCFSVAYLISPKYCHRFVGYLEEEAVKTYTMCLKDIDTPGHPISHWNTTPAPDVAKRYWHLAPDATMRDVILVIRMDEAHHRDVNHTLGSIRKDDFNPYGIGK